MASAEHKQDGNDVVTYIGEQASLGVLAAILYQLDPNSFADASANITKTSRAPIGTRKKQRGNIVGIAPKFGLNNDKTPGNLWRQLRGFFCANYVTQFTTQPLDGAAVVITSVANADNSYNAAAGLGGLAKNLIVASGFTNDGNNVLATIATTIGTKITVANANRLSDGGAQAALVTEAAPPAGARIDVVGVQFAAADVTTDASDLTQFKMASTVFDFTTLGLTVGSWVFIGDTLSAAYSFATANSQGYARLKSIAAHLLTFDKTTFTPFTDAGAGKTIRMYIPAQVIQDVVRSSEVRRYYTIERQLGNDGAGTQSEVWTDSFPDEFGINFGKKSEITFDISYLPLDYQPRSGTTGPIAGTRVAVASEQAFNTSGDIYRSHLEFAPSTTYNGTQLCFFCTDANLKVTNAGSVNEALGRVNGFSFTPGDFDATMQVTGYLDTMDGAIAERSKIDCTWDMIVAAQHQGFYIDVPLIQVSGPTNNKVDNDKPITFQCSNEGIQNAAGYVIQMGRFKFLPTIAMPDQNLPSGLLVSFQANQASG